MTKAIIIEKEPSTAKRLKRLIKELDSSIKVIKILDSINNSLAYFKKNEEPDLLFMDVQLNDGESFALLDNLPLQTPVIFTSHCADRAVDAFKYNGLGYLKKPVTKADLGFTIEKFKKQRGLNENIDYQKLQSYFSFISYNSPQQQYKERFVVCSGKTNLVVPSTNIAYFEKDVLIYLTTFENLTYTTDFQTLEELEKVVSPEQFFRANRQIIVQANAIESFRNDSYGKLIVKLHKPIPKTIVIGREKSVVFKQWLQGHY